MNQKDLPNVCEARYFLTMLYKKARGGEKPMLLKVWCLNFCYYYQRSPSPPVHRDLFQMVCTKNFWYRGKSYVVLKYWKQSASKKDGSWTQKQLSIWLKRERSSYNFAPQRCNCLVGVKKNLELREKLRIAGKSIDSNGKQIKDNQRKKQMK